MNEFAGKSINHWFQFIKREHSGPDWDSPKISLDEEALLGQEGLNAAQVELLRDELVRRELLPAPAPTTGPLDDSPKKVKKVKEGDETPATPAE
jgi:hypothetical protein